MLAIVISALHRLIHFITQEKNETETLNDLPKVTCFSSFSLLFFHFLPSFPPHTLPPFHFFPPSFLLPPPSLSLLFSLSFFFSFSGSKKCKTINAKLFPHCYQLKASSYTLKFWLFIFISYSRVNARVNHMFSDFMNSWDGVIYNVHFYIFILCSSSSPYPTH